jgi:hypothetical protein
MQSVEYDDAEERCDEAHCWLLHCARLFHRAKQTRKTDFHKFNRAKIQLSRAASEYAKAHAKTQI